MTRGTLIVPLVFFLSSLCFSQISVSNLFRERIAKVGVTYKDEIVILNTSQQKKEVLIRKKNLKMTIDGIKFIDCEEEKYSLCAWLKLKWERFTIEPMSKVVIPYRITIPEKVEPATYHCLLIISAKTPVKEKRGVGVAVQHAIQILYHIEGGRRDAEIFGLEMEEDNVTLGVKIRNTGDYWMPLKISSDLKELGQQEVRIYNKQERLVKFDCSELEDKVYSTRFILDDGKDFIKPFHFKFRKGEPPPPLPELKKIRSERLAKRRKGKPYSLYANLAYGNRRKGFSLSGTLRVWDFSLSAGNTYSQYVYGDVISDFESQRLSINFRREWFSVGMGNYWYSGRWISTIRMGVNFRRTQAGLNYSVKYRIISANVSQRLRLFKKNFVFRVYVFKSQYREDWNLSLMIPIL